jgi:hypothetical protein
VVHFYSATLVQFYSALDILTARISGSSNITVPQTSSTTFIKKRPSSANLNFASEKKLSKETDTPEQIAINAAIAVKNRKIDAGIKEIRNRLVATRGTTSPIVPENRIAPRVLQQNVSSIWTRLVGGNDANRRRIPISNSISEQTLPQRASKVRNSLVGKNEAPNPNFNSQEDESDN